MEDDLSSYEKVFPLRTLELEPRPPAVCSASPGQIGNNRLSSRHRNTINEAKVVATGKFLYHLSSDLPGCTGNDDTHRNTGPSSKTEEDKARNVSIGLLPMDFSYCPDRKTHYCVFRNV
jgi:hypothetical protein